MTREFLANLKASRQESLELWGAESFVGETAELTLSYNAAALGGVRVLNQVIDMLEEGE